MIFQVPRNNHIIVNIAITRIIYVCKTCT